MDVNDLRDGPLLKDWKDAPRTIGTYSLWDQNGNRLLYVGVAGRDKPPTTPRIWGLQDRLNSHLGGGINRDANQFLTRVFDVLVLPDLSVTDIAARLSDPTLYDRKTKEYIREHVSFRCVSTDTYSDARNLESTVRHGCFGFLPLLNPERVSILV